jgi:hypothetical protein
MTSTAPVKAATAVSALAAGTVAWAALPLAGARAGARPVLVVAVASAVLTVAELLANPSRPRATGRDIGIYVRSVTGGARRVWASVPVLPWPEGMTVAVLGLEALHQARPWHTVVLGVVLLGFLLALHLAETADRPAVLRPQLPLLAAGLGLAALSAGAAALPTAGSGWLAVVAAIAAVLVAVLALPV